MNVFVKYHAEKLTDAGKFPCGWLSPDGKYYKVVDWGHDRFAEWYLEKQGENPGYMPANTLEESGWVHITSGGHLIVPKNMSRIQKNSIYDWMIKYKTDGRFSRSPIETPKNLNVTQFLDTYASQLTQRFLRLAQKSERIGCPGITKQLTAIASRFF